MLGKSDVLLEVVMVFDERAPPHLAPPAPYYQATSSGFERCQPQIVPSVPDIRAALARDLMQALGPRDCRALHL